jgi:hypothetical protein
MMDDKTALTTSSAGIRLIAQTTLFNSGNFPRLRQYITDNYHESVLAEIPASARLAEMKAVFRLAGKLRVEQLIAISKHQAVVAMAAQRGGYYLAQITVEEDYPHRVTGYQVSVMNTSVGEQDENL